MFAANNQTLERIGISHFFSNQGFNPGYQFNLTATTTNNVHDCYALMTSKILSENHSHLCAETNRANLRYQDNID
jgi:hypothetical protein